MEIVFDMKGFKCIRSYIAFNAKLLPGKKDASVKLILLLANEWQLNDFYIVRKLGLPVA